MAHLLRVVVDLDLVREVGRLALGSLRCRNTTKGGKRAKGTENGQIIQKIRQAGVLRAEDEAKKARRRRRSKDTRTKTTSPALTKKTEITNVDAFEWLTYKFTLLPGGTRLYKK